MFTIRRPFLGGFGRGAPPSRIGRRLALLVLAATAFLPAGCASFRDPCSPGLFSNCRLFDRGLRRPAILGGPVVTDACGGEPFLSVPADVTPVYTAPGEVIPAPIGPVELAPAPLEGGPIEVIPAPVPTSIRSSPNQRTIYETLKPPGGTTTSRRSEPSTTHGHQAGRPATDPTAPLLDLPPLTAVAPPAEEDTPPPVAPAGMTPDSSVASVVPPTPAAVEEPAPAPTPSVAGELPPGAVDSGLVSLAPGIARFKGVEPQLAGGSRPNPAGWAYLAELGYRTALDLRSRDEVQPGEDAAALHAGLRYVALPVTPQTINDELLRRFEDEISLAGSRPLYFFDEDGARAAVLWYLKLVVSGAMDEQAALREVEAMGPKVAEYWLAANVYLQNRQAAASVRPAPEPVPAPATEGDEASDPAVPPQLTPPQAGGAAAPVAAATDLPPGGVEPATLDPTSLRPLVAMILTVLSVPLAFLGRSALSVRGVRRLASLPGPARRLLSLPAKSDA